MICGPARAFAVQRQAFGASAAFAEIGVSVGSLVKTETEASEAFAACVVFQGTAAFEREKRAADLEAMSLLAHPVESSIEANEVVLGKRVS